MREFNFHRPTSVSEAVALLRERPDGKLLAGGQSLLPVLKLEMAQPSDLVSLAALLDLKGVRLDGPKVMIGALTTHAEVAHAAEVRAHIPALARLADNIGDAQVRNRGTLGGSIAHADPSADYPAALVALGATVKTDRRTIAADDFFTGLFETALEPDEIVTAVHFRCPIGRPTPSSRTTPRATPSSACSWRAARAACGWPSRAPARRCSARRPWSRRWARPSPPRPSRASPSTPPT